MNVLSRISSSSLSHTSSPEVVPTSTSAVAREPVAAGPGVVPSRAMILASDGLSTADGFLFFISSVLS